MSYKYGFRFASETSIATEIGSDLDVCNHRGQVRYTVINGVPSPEIKPRQKNPSWSSSNELYLRSQSNRISRLVLEANAEKNSSTPNGPVITGDSPLWRQLIDVHFKQNGNDCRGARPTVSRMLSDISTRSVHFVDIVSTYELEDTNFRPTDQSDSVYRRRKSTI